MPIHDRNDLPGPHDHFEELLPGTLNGAASASPPPATICCRDSWSRACTRVAPAPPGSARPHRPSRRPRPVAPCRPPGGLDSHSGTGVAVSAAHSGRPSAPARTARPTGHRPADGRDADRAAPLRRYVLPHHRPGEADRRPERLTDLYRRHRHQRHRCHHQPTRPRIPRGQQGQGNCLPLAVRPYDVRTVRKLPSSPR